MNLKKSLCEILDSEAYSVFEAYSLPAIIEQNNQRELKDLVVLFRITFSQIS